MHSSFLTMFFILFFLILFAGVGYCCWHIWVLLPLAPLLKWLVLGVGIACFLMLFLALAPWLDEWPMWLAAKVYDVGTTALIVLMYLVLFFLVADLCRLLHIVPKAWLTHNGWTSLTLLAGMALLLILGNIYYRDKVRQPLALRTDKPLRKDMRLVMVSDLHLGYHNRRDELRRWVELINKEHADAILIAGDIVDRSIRPLIADDMVLELRQLNAPVYACLGNHEYYAGEPRAQQFYKDAGIHLLRDTALLLQDNILLVGRDDRTNRRRKPLKAILPQPDSTHYTILLDHQPYHPEEAEQAGIDFQFSGHTHHGQVWPISWITESVYEKAFGSHQRGNTLYYISSGLGIWGAKVRIGTRSEYIVAEIKRKNS